MEHATTVSVFEVPSFPPITDSLPSLSLLSSNKGSTAITKTTATHTHNTNLLLPLSSSSCLIPSFADLCEYSRTLVSAEHMSEASCLPVLLTMMMLGNTAHTNTTSTTTNNKINTPLGDPSQQIQIQQQRRLLRPSSHGLSTKASPAMNTLVNVVSLNEGTRKRMRGGGENQREKPTTNT